MSKSDARMEGSTRKMQDWETNINIEKHQANPNPKQTRQHGRPRTGLDAVGMASECHNATGTFGFRMPQCHWNFRHWNIATKGRSEL